MTVRGKMVRGNGKMAGGVYQPENHEWFGRLCEIKDGEWVGKNPMNIPTQTLTAAGHGPRRTKSVVTAYDSPTTTDIVRHKDLRRQCLSCAETVSEVKRCVIIDCPLWAYRMGKNPHNPRRGVNPFK